MDEQLECMCLKCGISFYVSMAAVVLEDAPDGNLRLLKNLWCEQCGGPLAVIGKAGDEPYYRTA